MLNQADRRELEGNIAALDALEQALEDVASDCIMITPDGRWMTQSQTGTKAHTHALDDEALARLNACILGLSQPPPVALFNSEWELSTLQGARGATLVFERTRRPHLDIESQRVRNLLVQSIARGDNGVLIGQNDTQLFDALGWIATQLDSRQLALVSTRRLPDDLAARVVQFDPPSTPGQRAQLIRLLQRMDAVLIDEARDADTVQLALGYPGARNRWMMISAASPRAGLEALQKRTRDIPARDIGALVFMAELSAPGRITHLLRRTSGAWDEATEQGTSLLPLIDIYIPSAQARPDHDFRATLEAQEFIPEITGEIPQDSNPDLYLAAHDLHGLNNSEELDALEQPTDVPAALELESDPDATADSLSIDYINALDDSRETAPNAAAISDDELVAPGLEDYEDPDDSPFIDILDSSPATQEFYVTEPEDDDPIIVESLPDDDAPEQLPEEPWTKTQEYEGQRGDTSSPGEAVAARIEERTYADFSVDQHMEAIRDSTPAEEMDQYAELKRIEQQLRSTEPNDEPTIIHDEPILTSASDDAITSNVSDGELSEVLAVLSEIENEEGLELSEAHLIGVDEIPSDELDVGLEDLYEPHEAGMTTNEYDRPQKNPNQSYAPMPPEAPAGLTPPAEADEPTQITDFMLDSGAGPTTPETPALAWGDDEQTTTRARSLEPDESSSGLHQQDPPPSPSSSTSVKLNALSQRLKALRQRRQQLSGQYPPVTPEEEPPSDNSNNLLQALRRQRQQDS